jgi:5-deoxy-5-amino-3-dehydroquinate synthase
MAKYHFIARENLDELAFAQRIARGIEIKAEIVAADEREGGVRALLNYGHTLAHAIEIETNFAMAHGEAVALGLLFAAHLGEVMGRITSERVDEHYRVVNEVYGIDLAMPKGLVAERLIEAMGRDKKALESITFVLDSANGLEIVPGVREADIRTALTAFVGRLTPQI